MFTKSGLFLFLLTAFQVSARYKAVESTNIENEINPAVSSRIASGWEAQLGQFPYHVALRTVTPQGSLWRCGGAILSNEWVVTAGQCTRSLASVSIRVGLSFNNPDAFYPGKEWYAHPKFNNLSVHNQPNDIALVQTTRPIVYSNLVKPIRVQRSADAYRDYNGEQVYLSGHGRTGTQYVGEIPVMLRWVYLLVISNSECARHFPNGLVVDTTICTRYFNVTTQSPCNGDGGGPLVHVDFDGVPTLIGVWSFIRGDTACLSGQPTGYTRPGPYLPWFKEVTGIDFDLREEEEETTVTTPTTTTVTTTTNPTPTTTTTESGEQTPDGTTPEGDATAPPEDSEEGDDSESDKDDDMTQLLKRLQVLVKVKVRIDKYNATKAVEMESNHYKH